MSASPIPYLIRLRSIGTSDLGYISVAENERDIPFQIKRVYWTYFTPHEVIRGRHAHREMEQVIFAVCGSIRCDIEMVGGVEYGFDLTEPHTGLYVPSLCWRKLKFSHNAVLMCLASSEYSEREYIRCYDEFKSLSP